MVVLVVGAAMWLLGIFSQPSTTSYSGFSKLKPVLESTAMSDEGAFIGIFVNGAGQMILINSYTCRLRDSPTECSPSDLGAIGPGDPYYVLRRIPDGELFPIELVGCFPGFSDAPAREGQYDIECTINYDKEVGGKLMAHSDYGLIKGQYVKDISYNFKGITENLY